MAAIKEEELIKRSEKLQQQFALEEEKLYKVQNEANKKLRDALDNFLREYNDEKGFDLILRFGTLSEVLQHDGATDITKDVVAGMNKAYAEELSAMEAESQGK